MPPPNNPSSRLGRELVRGYFSDDVNPGRTWQTQRAEQQNQQNAASQSQNQYQQPLNVTAQSQPDAQQQPPPTRLQETIACIQHRCLSHPDTPQEFNLLSLLSGLECVPFDFKPTPPFYSTSPFNPTPPSPSFDPSSQKPGGQEPQSQVQGQGGGRAEAALMALGDVWGINEERLQKAKLSVVAAMVAESSQLHGAEWGAFLRWIYEVIGGTLGWIEECDRNTKSPQPVFSQPAKTDGEAETRTEQGTRVRRSGRQKRA